MSDDSVGTIGGLAAIKSEGSPLFADSSTGLGDIKYHPKTWQELLDAKIIATEGSARKIIHMSGALSDVPDYGDIRWTAWTAKRVYFPAGYDGRYWVASAPRNPCDEQVKAVGGGIS